MTTLAIKKRSKLDEIIHAGSFEGEILCDFYEKSNRRRLWAHDLVGVAELLERRRRELEPLFGEHMLSALQQSFKLAEAELARTTEHLALAAQRTRLRPVLGLAVSTLSMAEIPTAAFPPGFWIILAELAILMEDLEGYMHFRSNGLRAYKTMYQLKKEKVNLSAPNWFNYIRLVGEAGDLSMLRELDHNRPEGLTQQDEYICDSAFLYAGDVKEYRLRAKSRFSPEEIAFAEFVRGKSIAIVGPVDVELENGYEIDSYDLIMRFNYRGMGSLSESKFGSRTDLSFYIESDLPRETVNPEIIEVLNDLKYVIGDYTHRSDDACFSGVQTPIRRRYPAGHPFANPLFKGTHNAIQRAIADLARFEINNIKVFNSDLFISSKYASGYRSTSSETLCMGFTTHDPVSNFHFTKRMSELGVITADRRLTQVLNQSEWDYVSELQLRYGQPRLEANLKKHPQCEMSYSTTSSSTKGHVEPGVDAIRAKAGDGTRASAPDPSVVMDLIEKPSSIEKKTTGIVQVAIDERCDEIVKQALGRSVVNIEHPNRPHDQNLIQLARKDPDVKELVVALANAGFRHYKCQNQISSFVFHSRIPSLWKPVIDGEFLHHDGIIYTVELPQEDFQAQRLLVVFSSIADKMYAPGLSRFFFKNFKSISKYLPPDTAILRIADIGSVVGSFYLGNNFDPDNALRVQAVIKKVQADLRIAQRSVSLYGVSKGGTGALYHALLGNYNAVSVDPITADDYYVKRYKDSHFTLGTFPADKKEIFAELIEKQPAPSASVSVITSPRSPQFPYIDDVIRSSPIGNALNYIESDNPRINDHPDVGPNTIHMLTMLINMSFYGIQFSPPNFRSGV